jgi:hypothetical protein
VCRQHRDGGAIVRGNIIIFRISHKIIEMLLYDFPQFNGGQMQRIPTCWPIADRLTETEAAKRDRSYVHYCRVD